MGKKIINPLLDVKNKGMNLINPYIFGNLRDNLIAEWKFATGVNDTSGKGHTADMPTTPKPILVPGYVNNCYLFPGTGTVYIRVFDAADLSFTQGGGIDKAGSVCMWVNLTASTGSQMFICKRDGIRFEWQLELINNVLYITLYSGGLAVSHIYAYSTSNLLSAGVWAHVCMTYNGNNNESGIKIYLNGIDKTSIRSHVGTYAGMNDTVSVIYMSYSSGLQLNGLLDEVRIFDKELSASEITQVMNWS